MKSLTEILEAETEEPTHPMATALVPIDNNVDNNVDELRTEVSCFQIDVVKWAAKQLNNDRGLDMLETREVKDLMSIVNMAANSLPKVDEKAPLNILVQNIMNEQKDDC